MAPPPVYAGFGSMPSEAAVAKTEVVLDALAQAGQRGVVATGWGGLTLANAPREIFVLESAPHDWLFPQMATVVHHGGAGTTTAGLAAGADGHLSLLWRPALLGAAGGGAGRRAGAATRSVS